jgi:hypothetical protein
MIAQIRAAIRDELVEQFAGSSWWIDMDGLKADADLVQVDGLIDIADLSEAIAKVCSIPQD